MKTEDYTKRLYELYLVAGKGDRYANAWPRTLTARVPPGSNTPEIHTTFAYQNCEWDKSTIMGSDDAYFLVLGHARTNNIELPEGFVDSRPLPEIKDPLGATLLLLKTLDKIYRELNLATQGNMTGVTNAYYSITTIKELDLAYDLCTDHLEAAEDAILNAWDAVNCGDYKPGEYYGRLEALLREIHACGDAYGYSIQESPTRSIDFGAWMKNVEEALAAGPPSA